ncbi:MAG: PAS domain S-box protein [Gammaproteobacteria bacterium]|nr:PAS domain S-box protein [Gammaproteobacteria bacterium]
MHSTSSSALHLLIRASSRRGFGSCSFFNPSNTSGGRLHRWRAHRGLGSLQPMARKKTGSPRETDTAPDRAAVLSQAHLAAIVENSDDAIISKTLDGRVQSWNSAAERLFGYSAAQMIGQPITVIIPPELHHHELAILDTLRRGERVDHYETVRVAKDGRRLQVSLTVSPLRDATGQIIGAAKILRDISAGKLAEKRLREEARALSLLYGVGRTVAAELDLDRAVQVVTDTATELSGAAFGAFFYNAHDERGESYVLYTISGVPREEFSKFPLPRNTALFGPTFRGEGIVRSDDVTRDARYGRSAPYHGMPPGHLPVRSYLAVPVISRTGEVLGGLFFGHPEAGVFSERSERLVSGIASQAAIAIDNGRLFQAAQREIAARKRVEEELRRSERIYRAIGESIDFGTWVCDAQGNNLYASESFLRLVGLTQQQCSQFGWTDVLHPDDVQTTVAAWKRCVEGGGQWSIEHRFRGTDGKWHPVLARGVPVRDDSGKILCWAGINLDIAEMKNAADALREADRRKDEFLAILAHELRNPLAPMRYALAIARQPGRTAAHERQAQEVFERQLRHMSRLLDDLLDVSRITRGTLEIRKSPIELTSAIAAAIEAARPLIDARNHDLALELPPQSVRLEADLVRLSQVFANLLINAAKYTDPGGKLRLRAWVEDDSVAVSVRDNGIGITPEMRPRLFTLFSQARSALERSEGGLGIGLALVKGVVELHGGRVEAFSEGANRGSEFVVHLPRGMAGASDVTDTPASPAPRTAGLRSWWPTTATTTRSPARCCCD